MGLITLRSAREIRLMRAAGQVVWEAHQAATALISPGISTAEIDAAVAEVFRRHNAEPLFLNYPGAVLKSGKKTRTAAPFPAVTCISVNEEVVHGIPGERRLREGDIVTVDTGCRIEGWCGDAAVTHAVGGISPELQQLPRAKRHALEMAIELLPLRKLWSEVARELEAYIVGEGLTVVQEFVGHGIGRQLHEEPKVPNFVSEELLRESDFPLRPGLTLAIEPMVNLGTPEVECLSDDWTQVTRDRRPSAHFEHTIALTQRGAVCLTGGPEQDALL